MDIDPVIHLPKHFVEPRTATQHRVFAGDDVAAGLRMLRYQGRCEVAVADIFGERAAHRDRDV
jgi:hypothetical protein